MVTSDQSDHMLYCGRFQPFHNGHLAVIQQILDNSEGPLIIGVIINAIRSRSSIPEDTWELAQMGDERQAEDLNPVPLLDRLEMIGKALNEANLSSRIRVLPMPRPESYWELVIAMVPGTRTWVLTDSSDPFELGKQRFFISRGDRISVVKSRIAIRGTDVRASLARGDSEVRSLVPKAVFDYFASQNR
jgi:cytidyltransferase-like protein